MNTLKFLVCLGVAALALVGGSNVAAQSTSTIELVSGGTNRLTATATNSALYLACSEFDSVTLQLTANGHSGTASNIQAYVYRSIDSSSYEGTNWATAQLQLSGTTTNTSVTKIDTGGAASLKIVLANTNGVVITNLSAKARFKAPKQRSIPASNS